MKKFIEGFILGFLGFWWFYIMVMVFINMFIWFFTDETMMSYQPVLNIFKLI